MKDEEFKKIASKWVQLINERIMEIRENPKLIDESMHFSCDVGDLPEAQVRTILDDAVRIYIIHFLVDGSFDSDICFCKGIEPNSVGESLKYKDGKISLDVTFHYAFYRYNKNSCRFRVTTEGDYRLGTRQQFTKS